ncbi:MAG: 4-hydroxy-3-methylbut-2-enyl diphosphate reductase [Clostridia bacterium]|nr:4-hydroxy-3-methylbut-2-enyl diphosphate reductase [Clostridia bacterium]
MKIILASTAGFCFGVDRAAKLVTELAGSGRRVVTLGPLIHNPAFIRELEDKGVFAVDSPSDVKEGDVVVLRTHGVPLETENELRDRNADVRDATCPFVKKIHRIVENAPDAVVIAGTAGHPEVVSTVSRAGTSAARTATDEAAAPGSGRSSADGAETAAHADAFVVSSDTELAELFASRPDLAGREVTLVAQTTFSVSEYEKIKKDIKKLCTNVKIFDTICHATQNRQEEAERLSRMCDAVLVVGGRNSSNTRKLCEVSRAFSKAYLIEGADEIAGINLEGVETLGVTAGASTPSHIIKEVLTTMSEFDENILSTEEPVAEAAAEEIAPAVEEAVEEAAAPEAAVEEAPAAEEAAEAVEEAPASIEEVVAEAAAPAADAAEEAGEETSEDAYFKEAIANSSDRNDQNVLGTVMSISANEILIDIGRKQTGYVPLAEYSSDPTADPEAELKVGDQFYVTILKTNDQDGVIKCSKRKYDQTKYWDEVVEAQKNRTVLEDTVVEVISKGMIVYHHGIRVFIPASLSGVPKSGRLEDMNGTVVKYLVIELDTHRKRAVGSARDAGKYAREAAVKKFFETAKIGDKFEQRPVKKVTDFGVFVDIGGFNGMIYRTELSWGHVSKPADFMKVGDLVDVFVKGMDPEKGNVSLGYRKEEDNPWAVLQRDYPVGSVIDAQVVKLMPFGAFAKLVPLEDLEGLIPISQISYQRVEKTQDALSIGDVVKVKITDVDLQRKRITLSIKALLDLPKREHREERKRENVYEGEAVSIDQLLAEAEAKRAREEEREAARKAREEAAQDADEEE